MFCTRGVKYRILGMIDFEEELKNYKPIMEVSEAEDAIRSKDLTDMVDILKEMTETAMDQKR